MRAIGFWTGLILTCGFAFGEEPQIPVYLAVDASASMASQWDGATKWEHCEQSLKEFAKHADRSLNLGVVIFGGKSDSCEVVSTAVSAKRHNRSRLRMGMPRFKPQGQAALHQLLAKIPARISPSTQAFDWIVLTDGGPMCEGDFCAEASQLREKYPQIRIHIVGIGLNPQGRDRLACLASITGGKAYNANRSGSILNALNEIANTILKPQSPESAVGKASLKFDRKAEAGKNLTVQWQGPVGPFSALAIFPKKDSRQFRFFDWAPVSGDGPVTLRAPDVPGRYEVHFLYGPDGQSLAKRKLKVKKTSASLNAVPEIEAGSELEVTWQGPAGEGDRIVIYETGVDGQVVAVSQTVDEQGKVTLVVPSNIGEFELGYETAGSGQVLARRGLKLTAPKVGVQCQRQVPAGTLLKVKWQGPANEGDLLAIVEAGKDPKRYRFIRLKETNGETGILVPDKLGTYKVQYISGVDETVLAESEFRTLKVSATVKGPETAAAGSEIEVTWKGPGGPGDYLGIYGNTGQMKLTMVSQLKVGDEKTVTMLAPDYPGTYRLRYVTGQSQRILAETKMEVTDVEAEISVLRWVKVNQEFQVKFKGPGNRLDVITLLDYENPNNPTRVIYKGVGRIPSVMLKAPPKPGLYEVQYVMGSTGRVLAKSWLRVRP